MWSWKQGGTKFHCRPQNGGNQLRNSKCGAMRIPYTPPDGYSQNQSLLNVPRVSLGGQRSMARQGVCTFAHSTRALPDTTQVSMAPYPCPSIVDEWRRRLRHQSPVVAGCNVLETVINYVFPMQYPRWRRGACMKPARCSQDEKDATGVITCEGGRQMSESASNRG